MATPTWPSPGDRSGALGWIRGTVDGFAAPSPGTSASGAGVWMIPGDPSGGLDPVPWSVARSGSTAALRVVRAPGPGGRATVLRGVPGEHAVELLGVDRGLRSVTLLETFRGDAGSAFGAALAR